jgi:PPK2 family polyphosphate:nucleotide phosphotransferase
MSSTQFRKYIASLQVKEGEKALLKKRDTAYNPAYLDKDGATILLQQSVAKLSDMQDKLYAYDKYSVLIVLQAMDAAGKDGAVQHVMSGLNPQGVKVTSFKVPSTAELDHDYFWRYYKELPARGDIGIFNRSHYENVLVTRVHPEYIIGERIPAIKSIKDIDDKFWQRRFKQINRFEKNVAQNGTIILKFFLHLSKEEQKKRFIERIENPKKNWKFSTADLKERAHWDEYQKAYEELLSNTSTDDAPWFIIPADNKWSARLAISEIIVQEFERLSIKYPTVSKAQKEELLKAKELLIREN